MINYKEFRLGNYIEYRIQDELDERKEWWELSIIDSSDLQILESGIDDDYRSIPLTEEILLKFGFYEIYKSEFSIRYGIENFDEIEFKWNKTFGWNFYYKTFCIEGIKLVHQLQNLYFALTSEELTFK